MIVDAIMTVLLGVITAVLSLFPDCGGAAWCSPAGAGAPGQSGGESGIITHVSYAWAMDSVFPVKDLVWAFVGALGVLVVLVAIDLVTWVWNRLPFKSS